MKILERLDRRGFHRGHRLRLAVLLILVAALANTRFLRNVSKYRQPSSGEKWNVVRYEERFAGARELLEPRTEIGYENQVASKWSQAFPDFAMTRFALVPIRVVRGPQRSLLMLRSNDEQATQQEQRHSDLNLVNDFGDGVRLYRRETAE